MAKKLSDVVEIPSEHDVIARHNLLMRHSGLHGASKEHLEVIDFVKIAYSNPAKYGVRAIDLRNFLNPHERKNLETIHTRILDMYLDYYKFSGKIELQKVSPDIKKLDQLRWKKMVEITRKIDSAISTYGIAVKGRLYRFMDTPFASTTLYSYTSWSLYPLEEFCHSEKSCHLYIIEKFLSPIHPLYIELPMQELSKWEYEFLLPRGIKYTTIRTEKHNIVDPNFRYREKKRSGKITLFVHYINITGIKKIPAISLPKFTTKTITFG
jgi:hypothetical protein